MPYTPPSQRSPASTKPNSPILSRNHSYSTDLFSPSGINHRPALPRSISSTTYLHKHRRTPSISEKNGGDGRPNGAKPEAAGDRHGKKGTQFRGALRQSPPPVNNLLIPSGAITTPPDSDKGSDDEDRGRRLGSLADLKEALSNIEVKRGHSPNHEGDPKAAPLEDAPQPERPALTPEARKISHSRSSSEVNLSSYNTNYTFSPVQTSESSEDEDDELRIKPPLIRKKSGELVKPALRPSSWRRPLSMPGTPTYAKAVHFDTDLEQVRHFLQVDRPIAVSAGSSPVENYDSESEYPFDYEDYAPRHLEWEIKLSNFPDDCPERRLLPVRVERIFLSADSKNLIGTVAVANLAYQKLVIARFTLDYWKTTSEIVAEYNNDVRRQLYDDGYDRFNFNIRLTDQAHLESKTLLLCVRYQVGGQEFWDNNNFMNFQVDFARKTKSKSKAGAAQGFGTGSLGAIPRSRHTSSVPRPRSYPNFDDDFGHCFEQRYRWGSGIAPNSLRKNRSKSSNFHSEQASRRNGACSQAFSTRYDFTASLSAALANAQTQLGGWSPEDPSRPAPGYFDRSNGSVPDPTSSLSPRPDALSSEKPDLKSAEYNELIQKYCFFGSGKNSPKETTKDLDGARDTDSDSSSGSNSGSPSPEMLSQLDGADDYVNSKNQTLLFSRSTSPGPVTGSDIHDRTTSPVNFGYPYNQRMHGGLLSESHTPQAILG